MTKHTPAHENPVDEKFVTEAAERHGVDPDVLTEALRLTNEDVQHYLGELLAKEDRIRHHSDDQLTMLLRHGHHWQSVVEAITDRLDSSVDDDRLAKAMRMAHDNYAKGYWRQCGFKSKQDAVGGVGHADAFHVVFE
jgi:hypothetical protein